MSLLEARKTYKPFEYPWAYEFWKRQQQIHWMPEEVPLGEDCRDWAQNITEHERNLLTQIFRFFTQADVEVQDCYHDKYGRVFKPTEIKMMLAAFSPSLITSLFSCSRGAPRCNSPPSATTCRRMASKRVRTT